MNPELNPDLNPDLQAAVQALAAGGVIAYPTESVYGLGCSPWNEAAVHRLLSIKQRAVEKGLILLAGELEQVEDYLFDLTLEQRDRVVSTWPGPVTWLLPATSLVPRWISGEHSSVAVRVTEHPLASALSFAFGAPLVSTSANRAGEPALRTYEDVQAAFGESLDFILPGFVSGLENPTEIRDALTGAVVRSA